MDKLLADLRDLDTRLDALLAHDELTAEQRAELDALEKQRTSLAAQVKREQAKAAREQERQRLEAEAAHQADLAEAARKLAEERAGRTVARGRLTDPDPAPANPGGPAAAVATVPATPRLYGALKHFRDTRNGRPAAERAHRFGMWALAQLHRQLPNRYQFPHAEAFVRKYMAVATSKDATGYQYLIPEEFTTDIIDLREQYGVARRVFKIVPMNRDTLTIPRRQSGLTAYFAGEALPGTESNKTWDQVRLNARKLMCLSRTSNEVQADAVINWGDDLAGEIAYAFALKEDQCAFLGDGTSTYGGIVGVVTKLQDVDGAGTDSAGLITGAGNAYSEQILSDFQRVVGALPQYADTPAVNWITHRGFYYGTMQRLELAAGGVTSTEITSGGRGRPLFLGYPVTFSQVLPSAEANSQVVALLGDFGLGAAFGDRGGEEVEFSDEATVNGESMWERDELGIRGKERFDVNVHDVGDATTAGPIVGLQTAAS